MNFNQAAEITSLSKSSLRRMVKDGPLRVVKFEHRVVIPVDALKELVGFGAGEGKSSLAESAVAP